jgi:hypothetical protein
MKNGATTFEQAAFPLFTQFLKLNIFITKTYGKYKLVILKQFINKFRNSYQVDYDKYQFQNEYV